MENFGFQVRRDYAAEDWGTRALPDISSVWGAVADMARVLKRDCEREGRGLEGVRVVVTDDRGDIVIGMGLKTAVAGLLKHAN